MAHDLMKKQRKQPIHSIIRTLQTEKPNYALVQKIRMLHLGDSLYDLLNSTMYNYTYAVSSL